MGALRIGLLYLILQNKLKVMLRLKFAARAESRQEYMLNFLALIAVKV
jgi:hypothetical protein